MRTKRLTDGTVVEDPGVDPTIPTRYEGRPLAERQWDAPAATEQMPPPAPQVVREQHVVHEPVVVHDTPQPVVAAGSVQTVTSRSFSPASALAVIAAVVLGVIGGVAVARAGLDGSLSRPVVSVAGFDHTALLGLIEIGAAVLLLIAGLTRSRGAILFFSILIGAAALIVAIQPSSVQNRLAMERGFAVIVAIVAFVLAVIAAVLPDVRRTSSHVETV